MSTWPVQGAKARFSELLDTRVREGPQIVTQSGAETAVLVLFERCRKLNEPACPTLKERLADPSGRGEIELPPRGEARRRAPPELD